MYINHFSGLSVQQAHPQEAVSDSAEGFPVEKVAPAAHSLTDEEPDSHHIQHSADLNFLDLAQHQHAHDGTQDATVNGQAAVPDPQDFNKIAAVMLPLKGAIVQTGTENGKGSDKEHAVQKVIFLDTEQLCTLAAVNDSQQQTHRNDQAIKMHGKGPDGEGSGRVDVNAKQGKGNVCKITGVHSITSVFNVWGKSQRGHCVLPGRCASGKIPHPPNGWSGTLPGN